MKHGELVRMRGMVISENRIEYSLAICMVNKEGVSNTVCGMLRDCLPEVRI